MLTIQARQCLVQSRYYPWLLWSLAASAFFIEYFARVAPGVMVDSLMRDGIEDYLEIKYICWNE